MGRGGFTGGRRGVAGKGWEVCVGVYRATTGEGEPPATVGGGDTREDRHCGLDIGSLLSMMDKIVSSRRGQFLSPLALQLVCKISSMYLLASFVTDVCLLNVSSSCTTPIGNYFFDHGYDHTMKLSFTPENTSKAFDKLNACGIGVQYPAIVRPDFLAQTHAGTAKQRLGSVYTIHTCVEGMGYLCY